jgi:hypothetical protein
MRSKARAIAMGAVSVALFVVVAGLASTRLDAQPAA